ncbi:endo-1,3-1,4-beta-D-glucanase [Zopfia rhizophila CBS 207.26]|uniref:Endo-1,3-1,4-beta-D-glucanase n=1 Tax=Zopfia rhizophila CBS 207.26 TaxID=1314779 RepID=A0A6A6E501_9PEZI|nr:endo-1,3-1,4-beta-D-glucanase [Zopfia rhizophila CBS 207.26]
MSECCKSGFSWGGNPVGTETTLGDNKAYVTGTSKSAAILIVHDVFGWTFRNLRLLADAYAKEADATVYLPDFFGGEVVSEETMDDPAKREAFNVMSFIGRNSKDKRFPEIMSCAKALKSQFPKVGAIGFCYGGWAVFKLGSDPSLIDAVSTAHPSMLEKSEIEGLKVPVQILAPETDPMFSPELKEFANKTIPTLGVPYEYVYFPGLVHGFAARGDRNNKAQKDGLERAKRSAVNFFNEFLH